MSLVKLKSKNVSKTTINLGFSSFQITRQYFYVFKLPISLMFFCHLVCQNRRKNCNYLKKPLVRVLLKLRQTEHILNLNNSTNIQNTIQI